jgi:Ni/Fe-hydrogenase 1 B-type cytochrome subunit
MQLRNGIQRVLVWGGGIRLAHWVIALTTLLLIASGWAIRTGLRDHWRLMLAHQTAGYLLALALGYRLFLLFAGRGIERWRALAPAAGWWSGARAMLRFYASFGRAPLPAYYGHNPLWMPLYLLLFALLAFEAVTGVVLAQAGAAQRLYYETMPWLLGWTLAGWHQGVARALAVVVGAHIVAVLAHELKSTSAEVSAMINGYKFFQPRPPSPEQLERIGRERS